MNFVLFTIIKDEHEYLDEWISYHKKLGINYIYVFDDVESKSHYNICKKYKNVYNTNIKNLFTPIIKINLNKLRIKKNIQEFFMKNILKYLKKKNKFDWVFYLDVDEFLTFEKETDNLDNIFNKYNNYDVVCLQWELYNSSGHIYKPIGSVIENYKSTIFLNKENDKNNITDIDLFIKNKIDVFEKNKKYKKLLYSFSTENLNERINKNIISKLAFNIKKIDLKKTKTNHHIATNANWCKTDYSKDLNKLVYDNICIRHYNTKSFEEFYKKNSIRGQFHEKKGFKYFFFLNQDINLYNKDIIHIINDQQPKDDGL